MLYLVGATKGFDSEKAKRMSTTEAIHRIARGVYCDIDDRKNLPDFMRKNALRIANYLYPDTVLIQASAHFRGAIQSPNTDNHRLFLGGAYPRTVTLPHLDVVQIKMLDNQNVAQYCLPFVDEKEDSLGKMSLKIAADELIFLHNFGHRRYNLDRFLSDQEMVGLRANLETKHGSDVRNRLKSIARTIGDMETELDGALKMLDAPVPELDQKVQNLHEFHVGWYKRPIAKIAFDGVTWKFNYDTGWMLPLSAEEISLGQFPTFVLNMAPQGFLDSAIADGMQNSKTPAKLLTSSERYLTNISIVKDRDRIPQLPVDYLHGRISDYVDQQGAFNGRLVGVPEVDEMFVREIRSLIARKTMPRMSGYQAKIPMHLDDKGNMSPAEHLPFTHILKLPGIEKDKDYCRGAIEWASMTLARAGGIKTADFSIVPLEDGSIAYVTERFDIPRDSDDMRLIFAEDFLSVMGLAPHAAGLFESEETISVLKRVSSSYEEDAEELFRQFTASVLLENGDLHLKNLAIVKVASPTLDSFRSVRLSPAYDIMNTKFFEEFPTPDEDFVSTVMPISGENDVITIDHLVEFAEQLGIQPTRAEDIAYSLACGISHEAKRLINEIPEIIKKQPKVMINVERALERAVIRCNHMFNDIEPDISITNNSKKSSAGRNSRP